MQFFETYEDTRYVRHRRPRWRGQHVRPRVGRHVRHVPDLPVRAVAAAVIAGSGVVVAVSLLSAPLPVPSAPPLAAPAPSVFGLPSALPGSLSTPGPSSTGTRPPAPTSSPPGRGPGPVQATSGPVLVVPASSISAAQPVDAAPTAPSASPATAANGYGHEAAPTLTAPSPTPTACVAPTPSLTDSPTPDPSASPAHRRGKRRKP